MNREALENAVYDALPALDMSDIERMSTEQLERLIDARKPEPPSPKRKEARSDRKPPTATVKVSAGYEVRDGVLVHVEKWRTSNESGQTVREHVTRCGARVSFDGRTVAASLLRHFLTTGEWVTRAPRPRKPFRAQVRSGGRVVYLGHFATVEDRDAAVFAYRLGVFPTGSK